MIPCGGPAGVEADKIRTELGINYHMVRKESADPKLAVSCGPHCRTKIMKLMKKAAALLLAASLAVSVCATPVFAGGLTNSNEGSGNGTTNTAPTATEVTYNVTASYTWSIPKEIKFGKDAGVKATRIVNATENENTASTDAEGTATSNTPGKAPKICVTKNVIGVGRKLKITIDTTTNGATATTWDTATNTEGKAKGFYVAADTEKLYFTISKPAEDSTMAIQLDATNNEVMEVESGINEKSQALEFKLTTAQSSAEKAGEYKGHVAFAARIAD